MNAVSMQNYSFFLMKSTIFYSAKNHSETPPLRVKNKGSNSNG